MNFGNSHSEQDGRRSTRTTLKAHGRMAAKRRILEEISQQLDKSAEQALASNSCNAEGMLLLLPEKVRVNGIVNSLK